MALTVLVIQRITLKWTKKSRGQPGAGRRTQVPDTLIVPHPQVPDAGDWIVHDVLSLEWQGFELAETVRRLDAYSVPPLEVTLDNDLVIVTYSRESMGAPATPASCQPRRVLRLSRGEVGQVKAWGRKSGEDLWEYRQVVANLCLLSRWNPRIFRERRPDQRFEDLPTLR